MLRKTGSKLEYSAQKAGMSERTARKYMTIDALPSQIKRDHAWITRKDPFLEDWEEIKGFLDTDHGLESKTIFCFLQIKYPGKYQDGQLRTLQRKISIWRASKGPAKEVIFDQIHNPGKLCASDYTNMNHLGITIRKQQFKHLFFHFLLTYSNWETGRVCFSESLESLSEGLQGALWDLGGVPERHRTDNLSAAIHKECRRGEFTERYKAILKHYNLKGETIQPGEPHENGDVEQSHYRFKKAVEQQLMMRGSRDFDSRDEYESFLKGIVNRRNAGRTSRFNEEKAILKPLPAYRLEACKEFQIKVSRGSVITVAHNPYSVDSRLIGKKVKVKLYSEKFLVIYANRVVAEIPRIRGEKKHRIQYRHIIDSLIRKPGAFENYRFKDDLFPTTNFRMAYDQFRKKNKENASKKYLQILHLAAYEGESLVDGILNKYIHSEKEIVIEEIKAKVKSGNKPARQIDIKVKDVELQAYDSLLSEHKLLGMQTNV